MEQLPGLTLLLKPVSGMCDLRCRYCFYADETQHRAQACAGVMREETAGRLIREASELVRDGGSVTFAFQGGEPTLAGLPFYRDFVRMAEEAAQGRVAVSFSLQTNGQRIDREWAAFLREHHFLVGVSLDGTQTLHDRFRVDAAGGGTYDRAAAAVKLLTDLGVDVNLLCVVNAATVRQPKAVYRSLREMGTGYLQFIPCLDPIDTPPGDMAWSLQPEDYGRFLCTVFDLWHRDLIQGRYVSIRQFEDWVRLGAGLPPDTCAACGLCGGYLAVEADGSLYPCDFYCLDEWRLESASLRQAMTCQRMEDFRKRALAKPAPCAACPYRALCRGGCPRDWLTRDGQTQDRFCASYRMLFDYAAPRIRELAIMMRRNAGR